MIIKLLLLHFLLTGTFFSPTDGNFVVSKDTGKILSRLYNAGFFNLITPYNIKLKNITILPKMIDFEFSDDTQKNCNLLLLPFNITTNIKQKLIVPFINQLQKNNVPTNKNIMNKSLNLAYSNTLLKNFQILSEKGKNFTYLFISRFKSFDKQHINTVFMFARVVEDFFICAPWVYVQQNNTEKHKNNYTVQSNQNDNIEQFSLFDDINFIPFTLTLILGLISVFILLFSIIYLFVADGKINADNYKHNEE